MIFEEQFPVSRYTAAIKIGNSVISLLWQLRCRCNPDHNKFSSSRNTTVVAIFPKHCLWRRSLCSNLGGIHPEKLYRATLSNDIHFIHVTLRILKIRTKLYKLLFINKQFGPQSNVIAQKLSSVKNLAGKHRYIFQTIRDKSS